MDSNIRLLVRAWCDLCEEYVDGEDCRPNVVEDYQQLIKDVTSHCKNKTHKQ